MAERSMFSRGGSGMTRGGLDRYLGPEAIDYSNLPEFIEDPAKAPDAREVDCAGVDSGEDVCKIADAEKQVDSVVRAEASNNTGEPPVSPAQP